MPRKPKPTFVSTFLLPEILVCQPSPLFINSQEVSNLMIFFCCSSYNIQFNSKFLLVFIVSLWFRCLRLQLLSPKCLSVYSDRTSGEKSNQRLHLLVFTKRGWSFLLIHCYNRPLFRIRWQMTPSLVYNR